MKSILSLFISLVVFFILPFQVLALAPPTQISPTNDSIVISPKLEWQASSDPLYSTNPYKVQLADNPDFTSPKTPYYTSNTYYSPTTLSNTTWYWKVNARDNDGNWSGWSSVWSFTLTSATPPPSPVPTPTPTPKPTLTPTPKPTPLPSPSATPKKTSTPTPTPIPTPSPTPTSTPTPTSITKIIPSPTINRTIRIASVAAVATSSSSSPQTKVEVKDQKQNNPIIWIGIIFIIAGAGSIGYIYLRQNEKLHFPFRR